MSDVVAWAGDGWIYFVKDYAPSDMLRTELWRLKPGGEPQKVNFDWPYCTIYGMGVLPDGALGLTLNDHDCDPDALNLTFARMDTATDVVTMLVTPLDALDVAWDAGLQSGLAAFGGPGCEPIARFTGKYRNATVAQSASMLPAQDRQGNTYYFQAENVPVTSDCTALSDATAWRLVRLSPGGDARTLLTVTRPQAISVGHDGTVAFSASIGGKAGMWALRPGKADPQLLASGVFVNIAISPTASQVVGVRDQDNALVLTQLNH